MDHTLATKTMRIYKCQQSKPSIYIQGPQIANVDNNKTKANWIEILKKFKTKAKRRKKQNLFLPSFINTKKYGQKHNKLISVITNTSEVVGQGWVVRVNEDVAIDKPSNATTNQWTNPVDPVAPEVTANHGRSKWTCRVHWSAREWSGRQDVCSDYETNGNGSNCSQWTLLWVSCCCIHRVHQSEGDDDLHYNSFNSSNSSGNTVDWNCLFNKLTTRSPPNQHYDDQITNVHCI